MPQLKLLKPAFSLTSSRGRLLWRPIVMTPIVRSLLLSWLLSALMKRFWLQVWLERGVHVGDHEARFNCFHVSVMRLSDCPIDPPRTHYVQVSPRGHIHRSVLQQTPRTKVFLLAQSVAKSHLSRSHDLKNQKKIQRRWKCCLNAVYISLIKYPEADCRVYLSTESTLR